jgi:hypothetical protein
MLSVAREIIAKIGFRTFSATCEELHERVKKERGERHRFISGKDYLLPLLHSRVELKFGFRGNREQFKAELAQHYSPGIEPFLAARLRRIVGIQ